MADKNLVEIIGSLVRDVEIRRTKTGKSVANFTIVTKIGKSTEFHNLVAWEKLAEALEPLSKGSVIGVRGYLQTRDWEQNGVKKYRTEIIANNIVVEGAQEPANEDFSEAPTDEDIPF